MLVGSVGCDGSAWCDGHRQAGLESDPGNIIIEAAAALGADEALPALRRLKNMGWQDRDSWPSILDEAIEACSR